MMSDMTAHGIEIEAKWRVGERGHARLRRELGRIGGTHHETVDETNTLFDTADGALKRKGQVLRLRSIAGGPTIVTFKGPATYRDGIKSREETETEVADGRVIGAILAGLGFEALLDYRKTRETWQLDGALVALDTLDFGRFVEIEGTETQVRRVAAQLGLDLASTVEKGYPALMRAHRSRELAALEAGE
jgi:predicted adenylyl cyclase CyaB